MLAIELLAEPLGSIIPDFALAKWDGDVVYFTFLLFLLISG